MTKQLNKNAPIPPDAAAYLIQAVVEIAQADGFVPDSPESLIEFQERNAQRIGGRAFELMEKCFLKIIGPQGDAVKAAMARSVYDRINGRAA